MFPILLLLKKLISTTPYFTLLLTLTKRGQWYFISYKINYFLGQDFKYIILFSKPPNLKPTFLSLKNTKLQN